MKKYELLLKMPLRTQKILDEAEKLKEIGFYSTAILRYTNYLEHFLIVATLSYYEIRDIDKTGSVLETFSNMKYDKKLTFNNILKYVPNKINSSDIRQQCKEIKNIRNEIAAHDYFVIALDKTHRRQRQFQDVNRYRKFIRNLYKLIKKHKDINEINYFLNFGHPLTIYKNLEEQAYKVETILMREICEHVAITVPDIIKKIEYKIYKSSPTSNLEKFVKPHEWLDGKTLTQSANIKSM